MLRNFTSEEKRQIRRTLHGEKELEPYEVVSLALALIATCWWIGMMFTDHTSMTGLGRSLVAPLVGFLVLNTLAALVVAYSKLR